MSGMTGILATGNINIGDHITRKIFGLPVELDIVWATLIAGAIVLGLGLYVSRKATSGVPGKAQLFFETVVDQVDQLVESTVGPAGVKIVPLAVTLFLFILTANWLEVIPSAPAGTKELLPSPTGNVNLTYAMAVVVIIIVHVASIRTRGLKGYVKHYFQPFPVFFPINVIEEITKPITMTFRLFGNIFSGVLMITVIVTLIPPYLSWIGLAVWKPFDELFIGAIQAFIFALLTIMYLGMGMSRDQH